MIKMIFSKRQATLASLAIGGGILFIVAITLLFSNGDERIYRIARDGEWYPVSLMDKGTNVNGFSVDLMTEIAKQQKIQIQMVSINSPNPLWGLEKKNYDGVLSSITPSASNRNKLAFSNPYFLLGPVLIVSASSPITSIQQMNNRIIGNLRGSSLSFEITNYPSIILKPYDSMNTALEDLVRKEIDGVVMGILSAYLYEASIYKNRIKIILPPLTNEGMRLITRKEEEKTLVEKFNAGLKALIDDGTYNHLIESWGLQNTLQKKPENVGLSLPQ